MNVIRAVRRALSGGTSSGAVFQTALTRALMLGLNLATGVFVARSLGPEGRGALSALVIWPPLMASLFTLGIPSAFLFYDRKRPQERNRLFTAALIVASFASLAMIATGWLILPLLLKQYAPRTVAVAQLLLLLAPEIMLSYVVAALLQSANSFGLFNLQRYLPVLTTLVALIVVAKLGALTPVSAALCYAVPPVPMFFATLFTLRGKVRIAFDDLGSAVRRLLSYGARAAGISFLGTIAQQADQVLVISLLSAESMGVYAVALSISRVPNVVFMAINEAISAKSMGLHREEMTAFVGRASRMSALGGAACAAFLALVLPVILPFLYGRDFADCIVVSDVLLLELIASGTASVLSIAFLAVGRPGLVTILQGGSLALTVPLMLVLIPRLGLLGAALSLLVTSSARLLAMLAVYRAAVGTSPPSLLINRGDVRFVVNRVRELRPVAA